MARKLETIRAKIADLQEQIASLEEDRRTHDEAAARLDLWVDQQAEKIHDDAFVASASRGRHLNTEGFATDHHPPITWLAWLDPEGLKARLRSDLDQIAPDVCSDLPTSERREMLRRKRDELAKLEAEEEAAIEEQEQAGEVIPRRPDADPATILGTEDPEPETEPEAEVDGIQDDEEDAA